MKTSSIWIISIALIVSFGISALFIGRSLQRFKAEDRSVSVKGFAEREVKSRPCGLDHSNANGK